MINFYSKADEKRRGELEFVPERIEEKFMLLLFPKRKKRNLPTAKKDVPAKEAVITTPRRRVFCDVYYECV